jgi:hypothetical protein
MSKDNILAKKLSTLSQEFSKIVVSSTQSKLSVEKVFYAGAEISEPPDLIL